MYDLSCQCGRRFRSMIAEARHRHNFPLLCRPARKPAAKIKWSRTNFTSREEYVGVYLGKTVSYEVFGGLLNIYLDGVKIGSRSTLTRACELIYEKTHPPV